MPAYICCVLIRRYTSSSILLLRKGTHRIIPYGLRWVLLLPNLHKLCIKKKKKTNKPELYLSPVYL